MKINQRNTAVQSFYSLEKLPEKRKVVYEAIAYMGTACNLDIAENINQPINRVTPRTNELVKLGLVVESHRAVNPQTGKRVIYWMLAPAEGQQALI